MVKTLAFSMAMVLAASTCFAETKSKVADETQAVAQATAEFYASLNTLFTGDVEPMLSTWSHADDVTYMGPAGGFQVGWNQVREIWETQAALKLGGKVEPRDLHITVGHELAISQCYEKGSNHNAQGHVEPVLIRATNLFRKENGQWKMIGHHTDLLPFLEDQKLSQSNR